MVSGASNQISEEDDRANLRLRRTLIAASCIILLVSCVLIIEWNYKSDGVTVSEAPVEVSVEDTVSTGESEQININTADAKLLTTLPGVGEALAERIVAHRIEHGNFARIEDIMQVSGIGQKKFDEMKSLITVETGGQE